MSSNLHFVPSTLRVAPGGEAEGVLIVCNTRPDAARFSVRPTGDGAQFASVEPIVLELEPGAEDECTVRVRIPDTSPRGAALSLRLEVSEDPRRGDPSYVDAAIELAGPSEMSARISSTWRRSEVGVDNLGPLPARAMLSASGPGAEVDVAPDSMVVEPGLTEFATIRVQPRERPLFGRAARQRVEVRVEPLGGAPFVAVGVVPVRSVLSIWLPRLVPLVVAIALVTLGVVRVIASDDEDPGSAELRVDQPASVTPAAEEEAADDLAPTTLATSATTAPAAATTTIAAVPPEQRSLAFVSSRDGNSEIYVIPAGSVTPRNFTVSPAHDSEPAWSRDGNKLAFDSDRAGNFDVYVVGADGSGLTRLTLDPAPDGYPTWSPDGSRIAFVSFRHGNSEIYVMNADGSAQRRLTNHIGEDARPAWSPDGTRIAFQSNREGSQDIWTINPDGTGAVNLTRNPASDQNPAWSPDGKRIAFDSTRDGGAADIYVMASDGAVPQRLTDDAAPDLWPTWSPDGKRIAFQSNRDGDQELYVMESRGAGETRITQNPGPDTEPAWS